MEREILSSNHKKVVMGKMKLEFYKHVETTEEINLIKDVFDSNGIQYEGKSLHFEYSTGTEKLQLRKMLNSLI